MKTHKLLVGQKAIAISGTVAITAYGRQACVTMLWEMVNTRQTVRTRTFDQLISKEIKVITEKCLYLLRRIPLLRMIWLVY